MEGVLPKVRCQIIADFNGKMRQRGKRLPSVILRRGNAKQGRIHEPKSRAGGQEQRKSKVSPTDRPTDRRTEWVVESRARD